MLGPIPTNIPGVAKQVAFPETGANVNVLRDELVLEGLIKLVQKDIPGAIKALTKFSQKRPDSFEIWSILGKIYLQIKRIPEAKSCLRKSLQINPTNPRDWEALGETLVQESEKNLQTMSEDELFNHHIPETIKCFENAMKYSPGRLDLKFKVGILYVSINQFDKAQSLLESYLKEKPNDSYVRNALEMVKQQARVVKQQREAQSQTFVPTQQPTSQKKCSKCGAIVDGAHKFCVNCGAPLEEPQDATSLNISEIAEQRKRDETQYPGNPKGKQIQTERVKAIYDKAMEHFSRHEFNESIQLLEEAISLEADIPDMYVHLGINYYMLKNDQKGLNYIHKAIELNPYHIMAYEILEKIYSTSGQENKAEEIFQKLKSFGVMYTNYMCDIGFNLLNSRDPSKKLKDNYEAAKPFFERVLLIDPNNKEAKFFLNQIESLNFATKELDKFNGDYDKAVEYYRNQLKLNPNDRRAFALLRQAELKQLGIDL